jgi:hypothetical protein
VLEAAGAGPEHVAKLHRDYRIACGRPRTPRNPRRDRRDRRPPVRPGKDCRDRRATCRCSWGSWRSECSAD